MDPSSPQPAKFSVTCLDSETIKVLNFNGVGEDPDCNYAYPTYANFPSFMAKSGQCVEVSPGLFLRYDISSSTGKFEKTDNSWEIPDHGRPKDATS